MQARKNWQHVWWCGLVSLRELIARKIDATVSRAGTWFVLLLLSTQALPTLADTTTALPGATVGVAYSAGFTISCGGCYEIDFSYSNWDNGLSLTSGSGLYDFIVSGTPTQTGTSTLTTQFYDSSSNLVGTAYWTITTVAATPTMVALSASSSSITYGSSETFTATLSGTYASSGTVTFKDGATTLGTASISSYTATYTTSALTVGSHSITAVFSGDATTSSTVPVTVSAATPTVTLSASPNSTIYGSTVNLTSTLTGNGPITGTVVFKDGSTTLGSGTVSSGAVTFSTAALSPGMHTLTAVYGGDGNNNSVTTSSVAVTIAQATPTVTLVSSTTSASFGSMVTFTVNVTGSATGTVTFKDGSTTLGSGTISGGTATFVAASLAVGSHSVAAVYDGDINFRAVASSTTSVTITPIASGLTLGASAASLSYGAPLTLTASISGAASPSGTVTFLDGSTTLGSAGVSGTTATLNLSTLSVGTHILSAVYSGDTNNGGSTSTTVSVLVVQSAPTIALVASATAVSANTSVTFTASLTGGSSPTGTVTFKDGSITLGSSALSGSNAIYSTSTLSVGSHTITAMYAGDTYNSATTSGLLTVTVASITPAIASLSPSSGSPLGGTSVVITGTNLTTASEVRFGGSPAKITAVGINSVTVTTPAHAAGAVDVVITTSHGAYTGGSAFTYSTLPNPTTKASVTAVVTAQTQAALRFASVQLNNFSQRLQNLHNDGLAQSSFGLGFNAATTENNAGNGRADGEPVNTAGVALSAWRSGLRQTAWPQRENAKQDKSTQASNLPDLPQSETTSQRQAFSWWVGGSMDVGQQNSNGVSSGFNVTTDGVSFGGDFRLSQELTLGLGAGFSRSRYRAGDSSVRSDAQAYMLVAYSSFRPSKQVYIDAVLGYGMMSFDQSRYDTDSLAYASGSRGGQQVFSSLAAGYEWNGDGWQLSPYAQLELNRTRLDGYTESSTGAGALTYYGQAVHNDTVSFGVRGQLQYQLLGGTFIPQAGIAYQHSLQGTGQAAITYADSTLGNTVYYLSDTVQDSSQWLLTLGGKWLFKNNVSISLLYSHSAANSLTTTQSIVFNVNGRF